jgi:hypothetical protein
VTTPQEEAERRLSAYVHPSSAHVNPKILIDTDPMCRAYVDGFILGAEWQSERLGPLVEAARAYRDVPEVGGRGWQSFWLTDAEAKALGDLIQAANTLDEEGGE